MTQVILNEDALRSLKRLQQGLDHHDSFDPVSDDTPIFMVPNDPEVDTLYELPTEDGDQFMLGDLRNLLTILKGVE